MKSWLKISITNTKVIIWIRLFPAISIIKLNKFNINRAEKFLFLSSKRKNKLLIRAIMVIVKKGKMSK